MRILLGVQFTGHSAVNVYYIRHGYTVVTTDEFDEWLAALSDSRARGAIVERLVRMQSGLFGDAKSVGGGVSELRVDVGPGYRIYYTVRERIVVVVLCAGPKKSQKRDMDRAREIAAGI